jgi:N-hydroxyarylamine O-acetyltransferase
MIWTVMNTNQYLARIGYNGIPAPNCETLFELQKNYLLHVPFENLYIHAGIPIKLADSFRKVVTENRGGFCYELNGLFFLLLKDIGFNVKMISARVHSKNNEFTPEFDHMALVVEIDRKKYLVDVGFGEFALFPLSISNDLEINDPRSTFRVTAHDEDYLLVSKKNAGEEFNPEYIFSEKKRTLAEFEERCRYHQTSPESHFTQKLICSLPTKVGRITLTGSLLKITSGKNIVEKKLKDEKEVNEVLMTYFKLRMPGIPQKAERS